MGCLCLLADGVLRIQAKVREWQILGLAQLDDFFQAFRDCPFSCLLPMYIPTGSLEGFFFLWTFSCIYCL